MSSKDVIDYYDAHVVHKLRDFVNGNKRVELAWECVERWSPAPLTRILEVGCGVGTICQKANTRWPEAQILGVDLSPESIRCASKLFAQPNLRFEIDDLTTSFAQADNDLVVVMDVYEHVPADARETFHARVRDALSSQGRVVLTFPAWEHTRWMREQAPETLQPVDEYIGVDEIRTFAQALDARVLYYAEVSVWRNGDYAHAVIGRDAGLTAITSDRTPASIRAKVRASFTPPEIERRRQMVTAALGPEALETRS